MTRSPLILALLAWAGLWAFWLLATRSFHPTFTLAVIVTTSLVVAYALAAYVNHMILVPRFWPASRGRYAAWLTATIVGLTAAALAVIRIAYTRALGPDPDPYGLYRHLAIDLFGMAVHLAAAAAVVALWKRRELADPSFLTGV